MSGWIKLHRDLIDWEWYTDHNTCRLFIHCVLRANFEDNIWRGIDIKRGSFYTSLGTISSETGLSLRQIRTSLDKLASTGELTSSGMARGRMITVMHYNQYQEADRLSVTQMTGKRQGSDRVATTNKNDNKDKNDNNKTLEDEFDHIWILYGKKGNRKTSKAKYSKLSEANKQNLLIHIPIYVLSTPDKQYRKNFETYINQECWNDEVTTNAENQPRQPSTTNRLSAVDRIKANTAARREERAGRKSCGQPLGEDGGDVRLQVLKPVRGGAGRDMGDVLDGDYWETDG